MVVESIPINATSKECFEFVANPANTPMWVDGVVQEITSEQPAQLGTVYKNQGQDGSWSEFRVTAYEHERVFELTKLDDDHHIRYTFIPDAESCLLKYSVTSDSGQISERFSAPSIQRILHKLKQVIEDQ